MVYLQKPLVLGFTRPMKSEPKYFKASDELFKAN